jgi:dTMP kinase
MNSGRGKLVVFEGPDGAGKTTVAHAYANHLRERGLRVKELSFPGRETGTLGLLVYRIHHEPKNFGILTHTPESLQALHLAAHLDAIDRVIRPELQNGSVVVLDRFWWSTWVYGVASGAQKSTIEALIASEIEHWGHTLPAVLLLITRQDSLRQSDAGELWQRRMDLYREVAAKEKDRYPIFEIPNEGDVADAVLRITKASPEVDSIRMQEANNHGN